MKLCCLELYIQGIKLQKRKEVIFTQMRVVTGLVTSGGGRGGHWERVGLRVFLDLQDGYYCVFFKLIKLYIYVLQSLLCYNSPFYKRLNTYNVDFQEFRIITILANLGKEHFLSDCYYQPVSTIPFSMAKVLNKYLTFKTHKLFMGILF